MSAQSGERGGRFVTTASGRRIYHGQNQLQQTRSGGFFYVSATGRRVYVGRVGGEGQAGQAGGAQAVRTETPHPEPAQHHSIVAPPSAVAPPAPPAPPPPLPEHLRINRARAQLGRISHDEMMALQHIHDAGASGHRLEPSVAASLEARGYARPGSDGRHVLTQEYGDAMRLRAQARDASVAASETGSAADHQSAAGQHRLAEQAYRRLGRDDRADEAASAAARHEERAREMQRPTAPPPPPPLPAPSHQSAQPPSQVTYGYGRYQRTASFDSMVASLRGRVEQSNGTLTREEARRRLIARDVRRADADKIVEHAFAPQAHSGQGVTPSRPKLTTITPDTVAAEVRATFGEGTTKFGHLTMSNFQTTRSSYDPERLHYTADFKDQHGTVVGSIQRTFSVRDGKVVVDHDYFRIREEHQGKGVAADMMKQHDELYERIGATEINVHANIDVGGYTWALMGFDFASRRHHEEMIDRVADRIAQVENPGASWERRSSRIRELRDSLSRQLPDAFSIATYKHPGFNHPEHGDKLGKVAMLGTDWYGRRSLEKGSKTYEIGKNYYTAKLAAERGR
jgi:GNAT superfamily N-acetyltransferase